MIRFFTYGLDPSFFQVSPSFSEKAFISIGCFVEKKASHLTILAFSRVLRKMPKARPQMAGFGILRPICEDLAYHLGIRENVVFLSVMPRQQYQS